MPLHFCCKTFFDIAKALGIALWAWISKVLLSIRITKSDLKAIPQFVCLCEVQISFVNCLCFAHDMHFV
jgi:hypothetical protein